MERVIALLREKNHFLEKFFAVNENELINMAEGNFENVEEFYKVRDKILDLINCIEKLLEKEESEIKSSQVSAEQRVEIEALMKIKDEWVTSILAQDLQVLSYIDREKSNIIKELKETQQFRRVVGAYAKQDQINQLDEKI